VFKSKCGLLSIFSLILIGFFPELCQAEELDLRVIVQKANVRLEPDVGSEIILQVSMGTVLKSDRKEGNWYKLKLPPDKNGIERSGYIHSNIVEVIMKPSEPPKAVSEEPVKEVPEKVEQVIDIDETPELLVKVPETTEPLILDKDSKFSNFLGKLNLRLSGGPGFLFNGGGDIEKLRTGTEELMDTYAAIPGFNSGFDWTKLRGTTNFNIDLSYNITPKISVGLSSGYIGASSKNNEYSFGYKITESSGFSERGKYDPTVFGNSSFSPEDTRTLEAWWNYNWAYTLFAVPLYVNLYYNLPSCSSPLRPFYPYAWIGFGPNFCKLKLNSSELYGHTDTFSPYYYPDIIDTKERTIDIEQIGNKVAFGINTGVGAYIRLLSNMFLGLSLQLNSLALRNINTRWTEEGSLNHAITDEVDGPVFEESDSWERSGNDRLDFGELGNKMTGGKEPFLGYVSPDSLAGHWDGGSRDPSRLNLNQVRALVGLLICLGRTGPVIPIGAPKKGKEEIQIIEIRFKFYCANMVDGKRFQEQRIEWVKGIRFWIKKINKKLQDEKINAKLKLVKENGKKIPKYLNMKYSYNKLYDSDLPQDKSKFASKLAVEEDGGLKTDNSRIIGQEELKGFIPREESTRVFQIVFFDDVRANRQNETGSGKVPGIYFEPNFLIADKSAGGRDIIHEIGHLFGLKDGDGGIMNKYVENRADSSSQGTWYGDQELWGEGWQQKIADHLGITIK